MPARDTGDAVLTVWRQHSTTSLEDHRRGDFCLRARRIIRSLGISRLQSVASYRVVS